MSCRDLLAPSIVPHFLAMSGLKLKHKIKMHKGTPTYLCSPKQWKLQILP